MIKIQQSKIFEVYESEEGKKKTLFTINLSPGKRVYGERLLMLDGIEYREWDAYSSKLASLILKGCPNIGVRKNDVVLYLGSASGTTVSHVSDIVSKDGFVFAVDIAPRVMRDLVFVCEERKNIDLFLKDRGYALLAVKARSIDVTKKPKDIFRQVRSDLEKHLTIIDSRLLEPYQKDHCMFVCKK